MSGERVQQCPKVELVTKMIHFQWGALLLSPLEKKQA